MSDTHRKVLHIISGLGDGGAEGVLFRLCTNDRQYVHVVVSLTDGGKYGARLQAEGIDVVCLGMPRGRLTLAGLWRLWRMLRDHAPDTVQTWMYHANLIGGIFARLAGVANVCWSIHHNNLTPSANKQKTVFVARFSALVSHQIPQHIVCCSYRAMATHSALGYCPDKFRVIPNGLDIDRWSPNRQSRRALRAAWGIADETPLLGMVARFDAQKDHANLLSALGILKRSGCEFHCILVGTGIETDNPLLEQWIGTANIDDRVLLLGPRDDIAAVMNALDVHVLSSLGEAFPTVLTEAMACGTPCVTTDVGDAASIVGDTGWVVPPRNPDALAEAIGVALRALDKRTSWQRRGQAARERVATQFALCDMLDLYRSTWQSSATKWKAKELETHR